MDKPKRGRPSKADLPDIIEREKKCIELRRAGATYDEIATTLGYAASGVARDAYLRALKRTLVDAGAPEARDAELDRLERLQRSWWLPALSGDERAARVVLSVMDRRAKLLGLDAPIKSEIKVEQVDAASIDAEVARLVAMLEKQPNA